MKSLGCFPSMVLYEITTCDAASFPKFLLHGQISQSSTPGSCVNSACTHNSLIGQSDHAFSLFRGEFGKMEDQESYFHLEPLDEKNPSVRLLFAMESLVAMANLFGCCCSRNRCMHSTWIRSTRYERVDVVG